jgi:hypothetical protein
MSAQRPSRHGETILTVIRPVRPRGARLCAARRKSRALPENSRRVEVDRLGRDYHRPHRSVPVMFVLVFRPDLSKMGRWGRQMGLFRDIPGPRQFFRAKDH